MTIRVAAYQAKPKNFIHKRVDQILEALQLAGNEKIDFLCFPEGFLTGYYNEKELNDKAEEQ